MPVFDPDQSPVIPSEPTVPTNVDSVPFAALENLVTAEQTQLLDLVNQLKNLGISEWIDLPQIIVVGSQSSGKSSVLEAISRIPFPRGDILCTTFATEVTLVRAPAQGTKVRLRAGTGATQEWEHYLQQFTVAGIDGNNADEVAKLITTARQYLLEGDRDDGANLDSFLKDTLCIECTDPAFPPLTLIDLPGLIQVPNERQTESDVETVRDMVRGYMNNPKSIILAIVSAASDLTEHTILKIVKEVDPSGKRTLGIITKPDTLPEGSNAQQAVLRLARNENSLWHLDLGWHVVRNRTWEERDTSLAERDTTEQAWFETGAWSHAVDRNCLGIRPLRDRLAKLLELQTRHYLPAVVGEIRQQLHKCEADLMKLGPARLTARAQRVYLVNTSERLKSLVQVATEGLYRHAFFTRLENRPYRIRARAHATNKAFTKVMQYRGHAMSITPTNDPDLRSTPAAYRAAAGRPAYQGLEVCLSMVRSIIDNTSGRELPGMFNPDVVREVFVIKSSKWAAIATAHVDEVWTGVKNALVAMTQYCANEGTSQRMMRVVISGALERKRELMNQKLDELLAPHLRCHPITYDPCFEDDVQSGCSNLLGRNEDSDDEEEASPNARPWTEEHALSYAEAYYKIALRRFIDNVAVLVIEMCLLDDLADIFSPSLVSGMSDEELKAIAGESAAQQVERHQLTEKKEKLKTALRECLAHGYTSTEVLPQATPHGHTQTPSDDDAHALSSVIVYSTDTLRSDEAEDSTVTPSSHRASSRSNTVARATQNGDTQTPTKITPGINFHQRSPIAAPPATGYPSSLFAGPAFSTTLPMRNIHSTHRPRNTQSSPVASNGNGTVPNPATVWPPRSASSTGSFIANNPSEVRGIITSFPYSTTEEREEEGLTDQFQSITAMNNYRSLSQEELRLRDYLVVQAWKGSLAGSGSSILQDHSM